MINPKDLRKGQKLFLVIEDEVELKIYETKVNKKPGRLWVEVETVCYYLRWGGRRYGEFLKWDKTHWFFSDEKSERYCDSVGVHTDLASAQREVDKRNLASKIQGTLPKSLYDVELEGLQEIARILGV
ncbi:MAG: hypothetical protein CME61_00445 [Halobacteriovoraceae bacterium]|nr:hypothetical protein [Halobacteriovoraceae bacterium]|tara:strand:+ start:935 stop:1318 length:384 start_codon:yes stop_codon:yes gene_type:complete